jgi:hypothetical protein
MRIVAAPSACQPPPRRAARTASRFPASWSMCASSGAHGSTRRSARVVFDACVDPVAQHNLHAEAPDWLAGAECNCASAAAGRLRSGLPAASRLARRSRSRRSSGRDVSSIVDDGAAERIQPGHANSGHVRAGRHQDQDDLVQSGSRPRSCGASSGAAGEHPRQFDHVTMTRRRADSDRVRRPARER